MRGKLYRLKRVSLALASALLLPGCVVAAVGSVAVAAVKAPFQVAGAGYDVLTTSQEEADRNRGKAMREAEEAKAKAARKAEKARRKAERAG